MSEITEERKEEIRNQLDELESKRQTLENELWHGAPELRLINLGFESASVYCLGREGIRTIDELLRAIDKPQHRGKPYLFYSGGIGPIRYNRILIRLKELGFLDSNYPSYP